MAVLLVFSASALRDEHGGPGLLRSFEDAGVTAILYRYDRLPDSPDPLTAPRGPFAEASTEVVDAIVAAERRRTSGSAAGGAAASAVVAVGGGSAIDTGKAVSAALFLTGSVADYLEAPGAAEPSGKTLPFHAVPTTAGTGSEATKNAVLSRRGADAFKRSLRHDNYVPDVAVIDPTLHLSCPRSITAASGLDAVTQLIEALVSTTATPVTDALALDGLAAAGRSYLRAVERGSTDLDARAEMAYAAYLSGICLANAGLGVVHGLAGPAGALTDVPHGVFCGLLLPHAVRMVAAGLRRGPDELGALARYAAAGRALTGRTRGTLEEQIAALSARLDEFVEVGGIPGLADYGFTAEVIDAVARAGGNKNGPYALGEAERRELLAAAG